MTRTLNDLSAVERDLLLTAMAWSDRFWDEQMGLLWAPGDVVSPEHWQAAGRHTVRDSAWYALGLLLRDAPGDRRRAARTISAVLAYQYDVPGRPYHGTFLRYPQEPHPPHVAVEWRDYDPNWREFIMTTLASILIEYEQWLPAAVVSGIDRAFAPAVAGALERGLRAGYTNIALMNAFMLCYAGRRLGQAAWRDAGERMARDVYRLFKMHDTFDEYNSPTYYGVDAYALAQWRAYPEFPLLNQLGSEMEALLWGDIASFYHAGLRNICGPYDRSYGMDMRRYVAVVGCWIALATGRDRAPLPDLDKPFAHAHDFLFAPAAALLGVRMPEEARRRFLVFEGERQIERVIGDAPRRVATAWLGQNIMIGAEHTSNSVSGRAQFHPATLHWRCAPGAVGWLKLVHSEPVDARARVRRLDITGRGELVFQVCAPGAGPEAIGAQAWTLPGLHVRVETGAALSAVTVRDDLLEIRYGNPGGAGLACALLVE